MENFKYKDAVHFNMLFGLGLKKYGTSLEGDPFLQRNDLRGILDCA
jgi:hypothetical protein